MTTPWRSAGVQMSDAELSVLLAGGPQSRAVAIEEYREQLLNFRAVIDAELQSLPPAPEPAPVPEPEPMVEKSARYISESLHG